MSRLKPMILLAVGALSFAQLSWAQSTRPNCDPDTMRYVLALREIREQQDTEFLGSLGFGGAVVLGAGEASVRAEVAESAYRQQQLDLRAAAESKYDETLQGRRQLRSSGFGEKTTDAILEPAEREARFLLRSSKRAGHRATRMAVAGFAAKGVAAVGMVPVIGGFFGLLSEVSLGATPVDPATVTYKFAGRETALLDEYEKQPDVACLRIRGSAEFRVAIRNKAAGNPEAERYLGLVPVQLSSTERAKVYFVRSMGGTGEVGTREYLLPPAVVTKSAR